MELFAYLQIAQAYEQSEDLVHLVDRFHSAGETTSDRPSLSLNSMPLQEKLQPIFAGRSLRLGFLLAVTAAWSTVLSGAVSGVALAIEEYDPSFRPGGTDATYVPIAPQTAANSPVSSNCANALCSAACSTNNASNNSTNTAFVPVTNGSDNTFVTVRPSPAAGIFWRRGDSGPEVTRIQNLLRSAGYFDAASTGFFATLTEAGVKAFQRDRGLPIDGIVGVETLTALQGYRPVSPDPQPQPVLTRLQIGDRGSDVARLQIALSNLGFYRGSIDGVYAAATEQAVIAYQRSTGLPVSGIADSLTLARLGVTADRTAAR